MVGIVVSLGQARFQTGTAGGKCIESRLDTRLFNLQLTAPLLAQVFRTRTTHSRQGLLKLLDAPLRKFNSIAQAYLLLQPQSPIMARFVVESVSCVIPFDRFWIACCIKVLTRALFCWVGISLTKLKEQC
jgi:hypothetical protein